jgi:hypothetical protein
MRETRTALPEVVRFKAPAGFMAALTEASARDCSNASEFVRRATLEKLREMGVLLPGSRNRGAPRAAASAG